MKLKIKRKELGDMIMNTHVNLVQFSSLILTHTGQSKKTKNTFSKLKC